MQNLLNYTGWKKWCPTAEEYADFEAEGKLPFELLENEYLIICEDKELTRPIQQYCYENGQLRRISWQSIKVPKIKLTELVPASKDEILASKNDAKSLRKSAKKKNRYCNKEEIITAKNVEQACLIDLLHDRNKPNKLVLGCFGSGKTLLCIDAALEALNKGEFDKIIFIRNNVKVAGSFDIGYIPGSQDEKMYPFFANLVDHVGKSGIAQMLAQDKLEIEPLSTIRGRNFSRSIIFVDEAENLLLSNCKLILGRCEDGSEVWWAGDISQRDLASFEKSKGVETMIKAFKGNPLFGYVYLTKSERGPVASMADKLDEIEAK